MPFLALGGLVAAALVLAATAAETRPLLPGSLRISLPNSLAGAFGRSGVALGVGGIIVVLGVMWGCYLLAVHTSDRLSVGVVLMPIAALHMLILLAPPILSTDVFSYVAYSRMGALYHFNPYLHGPHVIHSDPLYQFIGARWITTPTVYGPLFTALGYLLTPFDFAANLLAYKLIAALSSLLIVVIVWRAAALRGVNQVKAITLVGLNPVTILYGVGGGHNDLLMLAFLMGAVYLLLRQRDAASGALIVAAAAVKLSGGLLLPFALAKRRRRRDQARRRWVMVAGTAAATVMIGVPSILLFGPGMVHLLGTLRYIQSHGDGHSIPGWILTAVGLRNWISTVSLIVDIAFVVSVGWLTARVWTGRLDWITAAGWATVGLLISAGFLLPWYVAWLIPLVALSRDRRLLIASGVLTGICLTTL
jgi:alpha-1,6-mannosyltransferase